MAEMPLGWRTDLDVLQKSGTRVRSSDGYVIVQTPDNPGYFWGNFLFITDPALAGRPADCLELMTRTFPDAHHVAIGLPAPPAPGLWEGLGVDVERDEVLVATEVPAGRDLPVGYVARPLTGDDWEQSLRNEIAGSQTQDMAAYADFARRRIDSRQSMAAHGEAAFFGVFAGEELVAELGIVLCDDGARYQSVGTVPGHRRRGLASHLLSVAGRWARDRGATRWVIVAEPDSDAARLYRACGLRPVAESWQVFRGSI
ncbi:MAG: GNAT family N-acetyltransferase [Actinobacteria bacterium]|nr:GNAT family N-acetyltransferase [Actinomycetota bacterium]MCB8996425.1 GNAT family N-acetyltransferase [Actinomycetota bacterium]MCB9425319.1 GNAT family N-acetyltransferase [Actinomycetota bacterium]